MRRRAIRCKLGVGCGWWWSGLAERGMFQVTDTPGLCDTHRDEEDVLREVGKSVAVASPGPHVILMVLRCDKRFTEVLSLSLPPPPPLSLSPPSIPSVFLFHSVLISLSVSVPLLFFAYYLNISIILSVLIWNKTRLPALAQNQHTRELINAQKTPHQHPGCTSGISEGFQKVCIPYIYTHAWWELL